MDFYGHRQLIDENEIQALLKELENFSMDFEVETPVIRKTPNEIKNMTDIKKRNEQEMEFHFLEALLVYPLLELTKRICDYRKIQQPTLNISNASIVGRLFQYRNFLIKHGCTAENILDTFPKSEDEVDILLLAYQNRFPMTFSATDNLRNDARVERAKNYLTKIGIAWEEEVKKLKTSSHLYK